MFDLDKFLVNKVEESKNFAKFQIGPLPKGFGHTIGNSIRRILLSSISGSAVTSVKISGIKHEYMVLDGMQEDLLEFILNLKNLAVRSFSDQPVTLKLVTKNKSNGELKVTAGDFEKNSDIEIANLELVLGTLTKQNASIEVEITIEKGVGYALPNEQKRSEIGVIPVDSIFSPVKHVKMDIVPTRVGQETDLDQIVMEVHTNGAATPVEAFLEAVEIFDLVANRLVDLAGGDSENNKLEQKQEVEEKVEVKKLMVSDAGLSTRLMNSLLNSGITDLYQMTGKSRNEALSFKGMGKKSFDELIEVLLKYQIELIG